MDVEFKSGNIVATVGSAKEVLVQLGELYDGTWRQQAQVIVRLRGTVDPAAVTKFLSEHFIGGNQGNITDHLKVDAGLLYIPYRFVKGYFGGNVTMKMESDELPYFMAVLGGLRPLYKEGDDYLGWVVKHPYHYWWYK